MAQGPHRQESPQSAAATAAAEGVASEEVVPPLPEDPQDKVVPELTAALSNGWRLPEPYKLGGLLGAGAYGSVFEAWDGKEQRRVAVKRVTGVFDDSVHVKRMLREVAILSRLRHKHIVQIFNVLSLAGDDLYIVMERCDTDLRKVCRNPLGVTLPQARKLAYGLVLGCMYLHSAGVYHRDLKPANCLADRADCHVRICDFNLARTVDNPGNAGGEPCDPGSTDDGKSVAFPGAASTGVGCGLRGPRASYVPRRSLTMHVASRWYRPPEVILRLGYSEAIDVWSAGCIIAELFGALNEGGRVPLPGALFPGDDGGLLSLDSDDSGGEWAQPGDQLDVIFDVLGTPQPEEIASIPSEAARAVVRSYHERDGRGLARELPPEAGSAGVDLLRQMLRLRPVARISMAEAARHPFFLGRSRREEERNSVARRCVDIGVDEDVLEATTSSSLRALYREISRFRGPSATPTSSAGGSPMAAAAASPVAYRFAGDCQPVAA